MQDARSAEHLGRGKPAALCLLLTLAAACATSSALRNGERAERAEDFDRAVVEYTAAVRANPDDVDAREALQRVKLKASQEHFFRGRRLAAAEHYEEAAVELQIAAQLNPTDAQAQTLLSDVRQKLRTRLAVSRGGKTELQTLIERSRDLPPPGLDLPEDARLPDSLVFSAAPSRAVFTAISRFADLNIVFDPAFRDEIITVDLRNATLAEALESVTASTRTFYRVTAQRTITIVPDTPAKRREYEEAIVRTFFLSNADPKEVIDLLRIVADVRQVSQITATNSVSLKDTPERIAAAARLITAIDKARPEVVIDVELLEVDRTRLKEYGLQIASPGSDGISGQADVNREGLTLRDLQNLTSADVFMYGVPGLYYRLLKNDVRTRALANPQLRTSEGIAAQARFGERVPVPITTFAPIATGGINQQPITSFVYEPIGVNIDITPRTHHNDEVTLALKVVLSNVSGIGFGGLPTFGNREISTTIRLKDGETNMLAGLIRDEERTVLAGVPGLSDLPLIGRLFANNRKETRETDIVLMLTPHIVRVLDLDEEDLRPFRMGPSAGSPVAGLPAGLVPRDPVEPAEEPRAPEAQPPVPFFPQPLQPPIPGLPQIPGVILPIVPPKKPGGGGPTANFQLPTSDGALGVGNWESGV
ncbi:MAG TPA: secretin N-terminal domain-containing protein [Vicinamibacterales bacterium]|nr:secretin N-terminal domain-containing protein [Vicinamibacterales bacterium]